MARTDSQIYRLLNLIPYIVQHPGVKIDEACRVFRIARNELLKELELINLCGKPEYTPGDLIEVDIEGDSISIRMADYFSRPFKFTASELISLYLAGRALSDLAGLKEAATFQAALAKLEKALLSGEKADLETVVDTVVILPDHPDQPKLQLLRQAMDERRQVQMDYYSSGRDALTSRRLNPLNLLFGSGNWYVQGWDHLSGENRLFRVDRIRDLKMLSKKFKPEDYLAREGLKGYPVEPARFKGRQVRLRFAPFYANWVMEQDMFSKKKKEKDGSVLCTLYAENFAWLEKELLRYGTEVEILEPEELRRDVLRRVNNLLKMYAD